MPHDNIDLLTDANDSPAKQVEKTCSPREWTPDHRRREHARSRSAPATNPDGDCLSTDLYTTFVSTNHTWLAATPSRSVDLIGGRGKIAIIEGLPGTGPAVERNAGYDEVLARHPDVEAIRQAGDWSRASGQRVTENLVTAHPKLDGIHFDGGEMAVGGVQALRAAGITDESMRAGKPFLTWIDGYNGGLKLIKAGIGKFSIQHPPRLHGKQCVESLIQIFRGEPIPKDQPMKLAFITPQNVDRYVALDKPDDYWAM